MQTYGAHSVACFAAARGAGPLFLAVANSRHGSGFRLNSTILQYWPHAGRFLDLQAVPTVGAHAVAHVWLAPPPSPPPPPTDSGDATAAQVAGSGSSGSAAAADDVGGGGGGKDLLLFGNRGVDQVCDAGQTSPVLAWDPGLQRFVEVASFAGSCTTGLAAVRLPGATYFVATGERLADWSYAARNNVWRVEAGAGGGGGGGGAGRGTWGRKGGGV